MATVVLNAKGELERLQTGKAPERPELVADNARQRGEKPPETKPKEGETKPASAEAKPKEGETKPDPDDVEDHDGLTPKEKRELTEKMQRAVAKRHREKMEAEKFAAEQYNERRLAEQRAQELEEEVKRLRVPAEKPAEIKKPERTNFKTDEEYQEAIIDFRVKEQLAKEKREEAQRQAQERQAEIIRAATDRLQKAAELVPDFQEVTEAADLRVPGHIAGYMQESEMFAELGYHFAQYPEVMERLAKLSPTRALVEVGKIESTLQSFASRTAAGADGKTKTASTDDAAFTAAKGNGASPSPTESAASGAGPKQSRAPVITPLNVNSASQVEKPVGEMTYQEAKADWEKRRGVALDRRRRH